VYACDQSSIVFAAVAISRFIEDRTDWSIKRFVRSARHYRTGQTRADDHPDLAALFAASKPDHAALDCSWTVDNGAKPHEATFYPRQTPTAIPSPRPFFNSSAAERLITVSIRGDAMRPARYRARSEFTTN
jgi:hypothetical protein